MAVKGKQRITLGSFDFIKGAAMIYIILGHTLNVYNVEQSPVLTGLGMILMFFGAGTIPLFFLISGYGFKQKKLDVMFKKSFVNLVIPCLWVALAFGVVYPLANYPFTGSWETVIREAAGYVISLLLGNTADRSLFGFYLPWWVPVWYLMATFVAMNVLNLVVRIKHFGLQIAGAVSCVVVGYVLFLLKFHYYGIPHGMMAVGFCYFGYILKKYDLFERIRTNVWTYVILVPITIAEVLWGHFDLCPGDFNNVVLDYIGAGAAGFLFMLIGLYLGRKEWLIFEQIKQVGVYTYWIICIHSFEQNGLPWHALRNPDHPLVGFCIEILLRAVLIAAVCVCLKKIAKYKYRRKMMKYGK